ncbi:MAG TPA: Rrf2 family transcriptional regulator [Anaerolineales bacterium]|nr:Rrf2 family transcriptional regulator [Anaerolineales bacterium]
MRLSKRGEYGIRAMLMIATPSLDGDYPTLLIKEISIAQKIPPKFLEQILLILKNAGLLHSKVGKGGGYYLAKASDKITIGMIIRALDGPIAPIRCVSQAAYEPCDCPDEQSCGLRMVMAEVREAMTGILDYKTLASVVEWEQQQKLYFG